MEDLFGNSVWKFCLEILFGYFFWIYPAYVGRKMCLNLVQRDLLISLTTLGSVLSFAIVTFWELIFGFGALSQIFWSGVQSENSIGVPSYRLIITFVF